MDVRTAFLFWPLARWSRAFIRMMKEARETGGTQTLIVPALFLLTFHHVAQAAQPRPTNWNMYGKFPDPLSAPEKINAATRLKLENFQQYLNNIEANTLKLQSDCVDPAGHKMTTLVKGTRVLIWPERYAECEKAATYLSRGVPGYDRILADLNAQFKADYTLPFGDPQLIASWNSTKSSITTFPNNSCDHASRAIVNATSQAARKNSFEESKGKCPAKWAALFGETDGSAVKDKRIDRLCEEAKKVGLNGIILDGSAMGCDATDDLALKSKANDLDAELELIKKMPRGATEPTLDKGDADRISRRKPGQYAAHTQETYENFVSKGRQADQSPLKQAEDLLYQVAQGSQDLGGSSSIGAKSGGTGPTSLPPGCDPNFDSSVAAELSAALNAPAVRSATAYTQQCVMARASIPSYEKILSYVRRCRRESVSQAQAALDDLRRQERVGCSSAR